MIGNLQNIDKNKKEKLINFSEIVKKNREKEKKEKDIQKEKFTIKIKDLEKDITKEKINKTNLTERKNYHKGKRSFSINSDKSKKDNNLYTKTYSMMNKNKKDYYPISKKTSFKSTNNKNQSNTYSKDNSVSKIKQQNKEINENKNELKNIKPDKIYKSPIRINDFRDLHSIFQNRKYIFSKELPFKTESNNISFIKNENKNKNINHYNNKKRSLTLKNNINIEKDNISKIYKNKLKQKENNQKITISENSLNKASKAEEISSSIINQKNNLLFSILGEDTTIKILQRKK